MFILPPLEKKKKKKTYFSELLYKLRDTSKIHHSLGSMGSQGHCCNPPLREQSTAYLAASQARLVRASDSDKAACLLSLYVIFMDPTSRRSRALEGVQFGDIRVPPLLFFQWFHPSADSHLWCAPGQFLQLRVMLLGWATPLPSPSQRLFDSTWAASQVWSEIAKPPFDWL